MLTMSGAIPFWASREPDRCPHFIGGYSNLALTCMWKPDRDQFEQFAQAAGHPLQGAGRVLLALERAEPGALPLSAVVARGAEHHRPGRQDAARAVDVGLPGHHARRPGGEGQGPVRRDGGHQLAHGHALRGAVPEPERKALQAGPHEAAHGLQQALEAAHRGPCRAPVQQGRGGVGVHALGHQGLDGHGLHQPGHPRAAARRALRADPARARRVRDRVRLPDQPAGQEGAEPARPGAGA